jgi:hypothetical protein
MSMSLHFITSKEKSANMSERIDLEIKKQLKSGSKFTNQDRRIEGFKNDLGKVLNSVAMPPG